MICESPVSKCGESPCGNISLIAARCNDALLRVKTFAVVFISLCTVKDNLSIGFDCFSNNFDMSVTVFKINPKRVSEEHSQKI